MVYSPWRGAAKKLAAIYNNLMIMCHIECYILISKNELCKEALVKVIRETNFFSFRNYIFWRISWGTLSYSKGT